MLINVKGIHPSEIDSSEYRWSKNDKLNKLHRRGEAKVRNRNLYGSSRAVIELITRQENCYSSFTLIPSWPVESLSENKLRLKTLFIYNVTCLLLLFFMAQYRLKRSNIAVGKILQENLYMRDAIKLTFRKLKVNDKSNFQSETTCSSSSFYLKNIRLKLNSSTVHHVIVSKLSKLIRVDEKDRLSPVIPAPIRVDLFQLHR